MLSYEREVELAEQAVKNALWELNRALQNVRLAAVKIEGKAERGAVWSTDHVQNLTSATAQVVSWNALVTERRNWLRRLKQLPFEKTEAGS